MKDFKTTLLLLFAISMMAFRSFGQLSPGDLVQAHAHLEGLSNCTKCHTLGDKVSNAKCLDCHKEIKIRVDNRKGYHASSAVYSKNCTECHSDHHGRNFEIIRFDKNKFDHRLTGYKLEGKHAVQTCADCHKPANVQDPELKKKKNTYLGLSTACLSCHEDYHQKTMSLKCENCHNYDAFKPAPFFEHSKTKFPLKGQHQKVVCESCHKTSIQNGKPWRQFKVLKFSSCAHCHEDVHKTRFGQNCADCHSEESFKTIKNQGNFDHSRTNFKLIGKHQGVSCRACHKQSLTAPVRHDECVACHTDYHQGDFKKGGKVTDCRDCHSEAGFQPSSFTIENHNQSPFPLNGAHIATPCFACHKKDERWAFRKIGIGCSDCHTDIHQTYLDKKYYPDSNCRRCHSENSWPEINFDHQITPFPLIGKHQELTCRSCHQKNTGNLEQNLIFGGLNHGCEGCHADAHEGQFAKDGTSDCSLCHIPDGWLESTFSHENARFKLDGQHINIACSQCHPRVETNARSYILYKTGKLLCADCH